jgi:hypothetical protein
LSFHDFFILVFISLGSCLLFFIPKLSLYFFFDIILVNDQFSLLLTLKLFFIILNVFFTALLYPFLLLLLLSKLDLPLTVFYFLIVNFFFNIFYYLFLFTYLFLILSFIAQVVFMNCLHSLKFFFVGETASPDLFIELLRLLYVLREDGYSLKVQSKPLRKELLHAHDIA